MRTFFCYLIFSCLAVTIVWANTGNLNGRIVDKGSGAGIPGANIMIEGKGTGTFSDGTGYFVIKNLDPGQCVVKVSVIGYTLYREEVEIKPGGTSSIEIPMAEAITVLEGVVVNRVSLVAGTSNIKDIIGSAHYLSSRELDKFNDTDINRVLRSVPGLIIQEEDGFGLRPNIGMRGTGVERSSKITLMEDGVLVAPAPYAAPAAYYFPSVGRMSGVEIRKGSSQIKYGPYTTGGAINFNSTPIPDEFDARINLFGGSYGFHNVLANAGATFKNIGFIAESLLTNSNGFKDLDNGGNTGFTTEDYIAKVRVHSDIDAKVYQSLTFKIGLSKENSNETYLGLTDEDFQRTPFRRYAGSQKDNMISKQNQWHLRYAIQPVDYLDVTMTLYRSSFDRNWYKLDKVKVNDSTGSVGITSVLSNPDRYSDELNLIRGTTSSFEDALSVKANNRSYFMEGIESIIGLTFPGGAVNNEFEFGIRLHHDRMDRYQWVDDYKMDEGNMMLTRTGVPGTESNYILDARAIASFVQYKFEYQGLTVTPGLRYENINYEKSDYGKEDPNRSGDDLELTDHKVDIVIPGIGVDYAFNEHISSFLGVHKGFSPPGLKEGTQSEISINYEAGIRYNTPAISIQSIFYYNDYANLLGSDLAANGGTGSGNQFNGGESAIYGIEYDLMYNPLARSKSVFGLPVTFNYTYTNATFHNTFESEFEPWGNVEKGDELPYVPKHQICLNIGLEHKKFRIYYSSKFVGDMRAKAGKGIIPEEEKISAYYVADLSANVPLLEYFTLFGCVNNIFNNVYAVSRRPAGLRPGMSVGFRAGLKAHIF